MTRQRRSFPTSQRRRTPNRSWTGNAPATFTTIPASSKVLLATIVLSNADIDETILRVVGGISVKSDQKAGDEFQLGAFGMIRVTNLAVTAGIASIPDPVTDINDDGWFVYVPFAQSNIFLDATGYDSISDRWYAFDSRAKRKIEEGTTVAVVAANAHATMGLQLAPSYRFLTMVTGT